MASARKIKKPSAASVLKTKRSRKGKAGDNGVKLRELTIKNFKIIKDLTIKFPKPKFDEEPDIFVLGSKNGLGKTSVLEAIALLLFASVFKKEARLAEIWRSSREKISLADLMIRGGEENLSVSGKFSLKKERIEVELSLGRNEKISVSGDHEKLKELFYITPRGSYRPDEFAEYILPSLLSYTPDPFILPCLMYFHSNRKVQEGNPELGMLLESELRYSRRRSRSWGEGVISAFKVAILRSLMSRHGLFEKIEQEGFDKALEQLKKLVSVYVGGEIDKLKPSEYNTIEFRIKSLDGKVSYSFDSLSSGQKEIISTLFLIWEKTKNNPGIVLIDEPELHLNQEWQHSFIRDLYDLAPNNQYILATHSEIIFSSVDRERRIMLETD